MLLCHGTKADFITTILAEGIAPRQERSGNWPGVQTRSDLVYLTKHLGHVYAKQAARQGGSWLIVEIDTDRLNEATFLPDEDFMATELTQHPPERAKEILTDIRANLEKYRDAYLHKSLHVMGNLAVKATVPPTAITRTCVIDVSQRVQLAEYVTPTAMLEFNEALLLHQRITQWLFGDNPTLPIIPGVAAVDLDRESSDRTGIDVQKVS